MIMAYRLGMNYTQISRYMIYRKYQNDDCCGWWFLYYKDDKLRTEAGDVGVSGRRGWCGR